MATKNEEILRKPDWLKIKLNTNENYIGLKKMMREKNLHTVCEEAKCPNIHECWGARRTATFMILGAVCTRACRFCAVKTGLPNELDLNEPERVAESVELMNLKHVVITAVARDDLRDAGSNVYAETVRRLTPRVRARATYERTLEFLRRSKELQPDIPTKSSLMVGLGETIEEIYETMDDLRANDVDILTIGQYLQPSRKHLKVEKYYTPLEFGKLRKVAMDKGFKHCEAGPMVRSSYHADEQVNEAAKEKHRLGEEKLQQN